MSGSKEAIDEKADIFLSFYDVMADEVVLAVW